MLLVNKFSFKLVRFLLTLLVPQIHYFRSIYLDSHRASPRFRHQWENRSWSGTRAFHWEPITISSQTATAVTLQPGASDDLQRNSFLRQPLPASPLAQHLWPQLQACLKTLHLSLLHRELCCLKLPKSWSNTRPSTLVDQPRTGDTESSSRTFPSRGPQTLEHFTEKDKYYSQHTEECLD